MQTGMQTTIIDASTGRRITGKFVRKWSDGITVDDAKGIRYFATFNRVIDDGNQLTAAVPTLENPPLW
jgi:hypothetical protein